MPDVVNVLGRHEFIVRRHQANPIGAMSYQGFLFSHRQGTIAGIVWAVVPSAGVLTNQGRAEPLEFTLQRALRVVLQAR
jgi:hypothetical protein